MSLAHVTPTVHFKTKTKKKTKTKTKTQTQTKTTTKTKTNTRWNPSEFCTVYYVLFHLFWQRQASLTLLLNWLNGVYPIITTLLFHIFLFFTLKEFGQHHQHCSVCVHCCQWCLSNRSNFPWHRNTLMLGLRVSVFCVLKCFVFKVLCFNLNKFGPQYVFALLSMVFIQWRQFSVAQKHFDARSPVKYVRRHAHKANWGNDKNWINTILCIARHTLKTNSQKMHTFTSCNSATHPLKRGSY